MLSMKAKYAIRALMVMAKQENKMLSSKTIAKEADVPQKFLDTILQELRHEKIVDSKRGIFGGYFLIKQAAKIMVGDVIRIMDGPLAPIRCASVTAYQKCDDCVDEATCQIRKVMVDVRNSIAGVLDKKSIGDMVEKTL
ncbi:MAG: Rrf2 family transcriptional regulator [Alphaproteobacteria bacterium]|nr:Rrf2 family transcriptional regulator [Alphaproteobacteria bacterium]